MGGAASGSTKRDNALTRVGGYLRGTAVLSAIVAVTDLVYMTLLGVPLAAPLAVLAFLGGFVPYIGGLIATGAILLTAWAVVGTQTMIALLLLIGVTRLVVSNVIRPMVYGQRVGLHPAVILLVLPGGRGCRGHRRRLCRRSGNRVRRIGHRVSDRCPGTIRRTRKTWLAFPHWLDRVAQWGWRLLALLAVGIASVLILGLVPLVVAPILLATILAPRSRRWPVPRRRGWSRPAGLPWR